MKKDLIGNKWDELLSEEWQKPYYRELRSFLIEEYKNETIYPPAGDIYNALRMTDYDDVKVVILGQDPYHEPGQAHGLAFSVQRGTQMPPSLINILNELESDTGIRYEPGAGCEVLNNAIDAEAQSVSSGDGCTYHDSELYDGADGNSKVNSNVAAGGSISKNSDSLARNTAVSESTAPSGISENSGSPLQSAVEIGSTAPGGILDPWAEQGVLLLNTVLTVRAHRAASHRGRGWEQFTDRVIELLAERERPMAFVLWGAHAQKKKELILRAQSKSPALVAGQMQAGAGRASDQASLSGSNQSDTGLGNYGRASDQASLGDSNQSEAGLGDYGCASDQASLIGSNQSEAGLGDYGRASDQASLGDSNQSEAGLGNYSRASDQASLSGSNQSEAGLGNYSRASDQASLSGSNQSEAGLGDYGRASDQASLSGSNQSEAGLGIDNQMPPQRPSRAGARHLIIEAPHPSPLSAYRGFFGGCYFSRCNYFLQDNGLEPVDWRL